MIAITWVRRKSQEVWADVLQFSQNVITAWKSMLFGSHNFRWCLKTRSRKASCYHKMQKPTDIKSRQRFIGFVDYLKKVLSNISTICEALHNLSCKDASVTWQSKQAAFKKLNMWLQQCLPFNSIMLPKK